MILRRKGLIFVQRQFLIASIKANLVKANYNKVNTLTKEHMSQRQRLLNVKLGIRKLQNLEKQISVLVTCEALYSHFT